MHTTAGPARLLQVCEAADSRLRSGEGEKRPMRGTIATVTTLLMLGQVPAAAPSDVQVDQATLVIASSGRTRLRIKTSPLPSSSDTKLSLELCSGDRCSAFVSPGHGENDFLQYFFGQGAPWPGRGNVALVQYFQSGTGAISAFFKVTVSRGAARCHHLDPPERSKTLPKDEDQFWGVYQLHRDGRLEYRAGSYKKDRTDACRACRPDTVLQCSWDLREAGFVVAKGCELSTPTE